MNLKNLKISILSYLRQPLDLKGRDGLPASLTLILARDDCSRILSKFNDKHLVNSKALIIVSENIDGSIDVYSSDNLDSIRTAGLIAIAGRMIQDGDQSKR